MAPIKKTKKAKNPVDVSAALTSGGSARGAKGRNSSTHVAVVTPSSSTSSAPAADCSSVGTTTRGGSARTSTSPVRTVTVYSVGNSGARTLRGAVRVRTMSDYIKLPAGTFSLPASAFTNDGIRLDGVPAPLGITAVSDVVTAPDSNGKASATVTQPSGAAIKASCAPIITDSAAKKAAAAVRIVPYTITQAPGASIKVPDAAGSAPVSLCRTPEVVKPSDCVFKVPDVPAPRAGTSNKIPDAAEIAPATFSHIPKVVKPSGSVLKALAVPAPQAGSAALQTPVASAAEPNKNQPQGRVRNRKEKLKPINADPQIHFETVIIKQRVKANAADRSEQIVQEVLRKAHIQATIPEVTKKYMDDAFRSKIYENSEVQEQMRQIAEERVRINDLLTTFGMREVDFKLGTPKEAMMLKFSDRILELDGKIDKPKLDAENNKPKLDGKINKPKLDAENNKPKLDGKINKPKLDAENNKPKLDAKNNKPKLDGKINKPKLDAENNKLDAGCQSQ